jgi:hypothetical protein
MTARKLINVSVLVVSIVCFGNLLLQAQVAPSAQDRAARLPTPGPLAYAIGFDGYSGLARFGVLLVGAGRFLPISDLPNSAQGLGRDDRGRLYLVDAGNNLVRIDALTGRAEVIGDTGVTTPGPVGQTLVNVFGSMATGELFLMDYANNLYSVSPRTGRATLIAATGIPAITSPVYSSSFAGTCNSLFFTIHEGDGQGNVLQGPSLYRIDPRTGAATLVGPTADFMPGSGFIDRQLYGFSIDLRPFGIGDGPHAYSIDVRSGQATLVSDLNVTGVSGAVDLVGDQDCRGRDRR